MFTILGRAELWVCPPLDALWMYLFMVIPYLICKRWLDVALSILAIIFLWPLLLLVAILVRWYLGSPVFFSQDRPGFNGKTFRLYKFRSMRQPRSGESELASDELRLTKFGRFLRSSSLDELPELWNILRGDMSFVGPRPLLPQYLPRYSARQARRHEVRPGLTGWAQVHGRNALTWQQRLELDVLYVENVSLKLDLQILCKTIAVVFSAHGVSAEGQATMTEFMGNE